MTKTWRLTLLGQHVQSHQVMFSSTNGVSKSTDWQHKVSHRAISCKHRLRPKNTFDNEIVHTSGVHVSEYGTLCSGK